jgi:hypothetical protein
MAEKLHGEIFQGTTFSTLLKDIYDNSSKKKKQIDILVNELRPLIHDVSQAAMIVPLIKEYLEVAVKNDEQLVKMAGVYQKFMAAEERLEELQKEKGSILTAEEKNQLLHEIDKDIVQSTIDIKKSDAEVEEEFDKLNDKVQEVKEEIKKEETL